MDESKLKERLFACGQGHVFDHWEQIPADDKTVLLKQILEIDGCVSGGFEALKPTLVDALKKHGDHEIGKVECPPQEWMGYADGTDPDQENRWERLGLELVAQGECAACVLAGGMGTRLGSTYPKGMLGAEEIGEEFLASRKSLFQLYSERIRRIQQRAQQQVGSEKEPTVWFLVMTGEATHAPTVDFFERHAFWGLRCEQVIFFKQGVMPCFAEDGRVLMETASRIATSPDGNAGIYPALRRSGALEKLKLAGVKWMQTFSVDNILVRVADPVWYGYCQEKQADVVVKTVPKGDWSEAVGVVTLCNGLPGVIEYSDIGEAKAKETIPSGKLKYNAANICLQAYSVDFLCGPAQDTKTQWHVAKKTIPTVDGKVPGIKLEGFIFDVFSAATTFRTLQVERAAEFSAIKNASDSGKPDTPQTALASISRLHARWLREAGASLPEVYDGRICEVSPLRSFRGEGLTSIAVTVDTSAKVIEVK